MNFHRLIKNSKSISNSKSKVVSLCMFFYVFLILLTGCTDMRLYKYYDFTLSSKKVDSYSLKFDLSGSFLNDSDKRITSRTNPYGLAVSVIDTSKRAYVLILEDVKLTSLDGGEGDVIKLAFPDEKNLHREFSLDKLNGWNAGMFEYGFDIRFVKQKLSGKLILKDDQGKVIFEYKINETFEPNYSEAKESDWINKILSV